MLKPLLLLDLDGPLNPFLSWNAVDQGYERVNAEYSTWMLHKKHGQWLRVLSQRAEVMWASTWEETANELACAFYGLPDFSVLHFGSDSMRTGLPFKLHEVQQVAKDRPLIWIDDEIEEEAREWTMQRTDPTLLIVPDPSEGWTEAQYHECLSFLSTSR